MPDSSLFCPQDNLSEERLAWWIENCIRAYEPRLLAPQVTLRRDPARCDTLHAVISGTICLPWGVERAELRLQFGRSGPETDVVFAAAHANAPRAAVSLRRFMVGERPTAAAPCPGDEPA